jgi:hypothetical protein
VTEGVTEREGFSILESCLGRPTSKNSVLEGLSMRLRFADIHEETSDIALSRKETFPTELGRRERNEKLSVVGVQMVMNRRFNDDGTWRSSVQNKQKRTKNRTLVDTIQKLINRRLRIPNLDVERPRLR